LGVLVRDGRIRVEPSLLPATELAEGPLEFTLCEVPFTLRVGEGRAIGVVDGDGRRSELSGAVIDRGTSVAIFERSGRCRAVEVTVPSGTLYHDQGRDDR
jgi:hypothetical protein